MIEEKNLIIPIELTKIIYAHWKADLTLNNTPNQIYGKALHGRGEVQFKNGNAYEGGFHNGMLHGQGKFTWANGTVYEGQFNYNRIEGSGKYFWTDGSSYEGQVLAGMRHGQGVFKAPGEDYTYQGEWKNGLREGQGKLQFRDGTVYQGQFREGLKAGQGKITYSSGNYYTGDWKYDVKAGFGTMHWVNRSEKYYGEWAEDIQEGFGVQVWLEPKGENKSMRNRYEGQWKAGLRHGLGTFYYANGSKYEGEWSKNLKQGRAIFTEENGNVLQVYFRNDRQVKEVPPTASVLSEQTPHSGSGKLKEKEKEVGTMRVKKENSIEPNPYSVMVNVTDLTLFAISSLVQRKVPMELLENLLLRNNSQLKSFYKYFVAKFESASENSFSLTLEGLWKTLRELKILGHRLSLASVNRHYFSSPSQVFQMSTDLKLLQIKVEASKKDHLSPYELANPIFALTAMRLEEGAQPPWPDTAPKSIHDGSKTVLYRNFVQLLVRAAYVKYENLFEINKSVDKLFTKIFPSIENNIKQQKKESTSSLDGVSSVASFANKRELPAYAKAANQQLFHLMAKSTQLNFMQDHTIKLHSFIQQLQKQGFLLDPAQRQRFLAKVERTLDPEGSLLELDGQERKYKKKNTTHSMPLNSENERALRLTRLLQFQIIFSQFNEFVFQIFEHKNEATNIEERKVKYLEFVSKLAAGVPRPRLQEYPQARETAKDRLKQQLIRRRDQQEAELRRQAILREEQERESQELVSMACEDYDVNVDEEDEPDQNEDSFMD